MTIPMYSLDDREAFLFAIFAAPDDDLPRLVYADWLDEHDEPDLAEFIRLDLELFDRARNLKPELPAQTLRYNELLPLAYRQYGEELTGAILRHFPDHVLTERLTIRGFPRNPCMFDAKELDAELVRRVAITRCPSLYGQTHLKIPTGLIDSAKQVQTLLTSPVFQQVVHHDLRGSVITIPSVPHLQDENTSDDQFQLHFGLVDFEYRPVITVQAVESLVNSREARRLLSIDLRNNDLDNDAARAIIRSKNLIRLKQLYFFEGNQLRGKTWAQLQQQFEGGVVQ